MTINKNLLKKIVIGASVLGTGGGGSYKLGIRTAESFTNTVDLISLNSLSDNEIVVTTFGVGGLKKFGDDKKIVKKNMQILEKKIKAKISYLMPVEIGPSSVANIFSIASQIQCSVIDADIVGYRASPEVFLETITLADINRCPLVAANSEGDVITINNLTSPQLIEKILRHFSLESKSKVYVVGYPMKIEQIRNIVGEGSVSFALVVGKILERVKDTKLLINSLKKLGFIYFCKGTIIKQEENNLPGFTAGKLTISSNTNQYTVYYKNEFLTLQKNQKTILSCPDSIILIDADEKRGINNGENNVNNQVLLFGRKALPIWRTSAGKKLFSPQNVGYKFPQVLL